MLFGAGRAVSYYRALTSAVYDSLNLFLDVFASNLELGVGSMEMTMVMQTEANDKCG